jgi:hypothetical protein
VVVESVVDVAVTVGGACGPLTHATSYWDFSL